MNNGNIRDTVIGVVMLAVLIVLVATVVRFLWPLIVVAAIYLIWKFYRIRKEAEELQKQQMGEMEKNLFYEQVRRKVDSGDIIDAEFTESEPSEKGNEQ